MIIPKEHKATYHKGNARHRGVTELAQYSNFVLEVAHDLVKLSNLTTGNQLIGQKGQGSEIEDNFKSVMTGDAAVGKSNLFTAATLYKTDRSSKVPIRDFSLWDSFNDCVKQTNGNVYKLTSKGLKDPVGMQTTLYVQPGQKIYMRLKVRSEKGAPDFSIGTLNSRKGPSTIGSTKKVPVPAGNKFIYVDTILSFEYPETISLNVNVHEDPSVMKETTVEVQDVEIYYVQESTISMASYDTELKPTLNGLEEVLNSI